MVGSPNVFLEDAVVPFSLRNMSLRGTALNSNTELILDFIHCSFKFLISADLGDVEASATV